MACARWRTELASVRADCRALLSDWLDARPRSGARFSVRLTSLPTAVSFPRFLSSRLFGATAASVALVSGAAHASDVFFTDIPVVLTASRMAQSPLDAPVAVTVIDREMIRASGFTEIHDLLRLVPGFLVADWPAGSPTVARHGLGDAYDRRIKVMIDGRTVNRTLWGDTAWLELPVRVDDIERLEVVRGANGAAYGVNAFDGVINIITRSPATEEGVTVIARTGDKGFQDHGFRLNGYTEGALDWRLSGSHRRAQNFRPRADDRTGDPTLQEDVRNTLFNFSATAQLSARDELGMQVAINEGVAERGNFEDWQEPLRDEETRSRSLHLSWQHSFGSESDLSVHLSHQDERYRAGWLTTGALVVPIDKNTDGRRDELELQYTTRPAQAWRLLLGAGVRREAVKSLRYFGTEATLSGTSSQLFGTLTWNPVAALKLDFGGTFEDHHYSGSTFSPRLAMNYALTPESAVRASAGVSYRAPSFFESSAYETIRIDDTVRWVGVRQTTPVAPERVRHVELGYVAQFRELGVGLDVRVFHERFQRYLDSRSCIFGEPGCVPPDAYDPFPHDPKRPPKQFRFVNSAALTRHGAEFSVDWRRPGWGRVVASQAFIDIDADAAASDRDFDRSAPTTITSLLLVKELPERWQASLGYYRHSEMYWLNQGDRVPITNRVDLRLARRFGAPSADNEVAIVAQSVNGRYPEFYGRQFRHEPQLFATLRLSW